jgi:hypothetical protein
MFRSRPVTRSSNPLRRLDLGSWRLEDLVPLRFCPSEDYLLTWPTSYLRRCPGCGSQWSTAGAGSRHQPPGANHRADGRRFAWCRSRVCVTRVELADAQAEAAAHKPGVPQARRRSSFTFVLPDNGHVHQQQAPRTPTSKRGQRQLDDHGGQQAKLEACCPGGKHHVEPGVAQHPEASGAVRRTTLAPKPVAYVIT